MWLAILGLGNWELITILLILLFYLIPIFKIIGKTGYDPILSFLMLIPLVNFVLLYFLAFSTWPIEKELKNVRKQ